MSFSAPTLAQPITTDGYVGEINSNFLALQNALDAIEVDLLIASGGGPAGGSNFGWLNSITRPDGVVGTESWVPRFSTNNQTLSFDLPAKGNNDAVINQVYVSDNSAWSLSLTDLVLGLGDGTYRIAIQLKRQGAGVSSLIVEQANGPTDETGDLTLYDFDYVVNGSSFAATNFRRVARVLASAIQQGDLMDALVPLSFTAGETPFSSTGEKGYGVHVPFDCEIVSAYATLGIAADATADFNLVNSATANVLIGTVAFVPGDGAVATKQVLGTSPLTQAEVGDFLHLDVTDIDATADELSVTVMVRRIFHQIY